MGKGQIILKVGADVSAATKQFGALNRTVKKATGESLTRSQKFSKGLRVAAIPAAAALAGIGAAMKVGFDGLKADEQAVTQLRNSLEATGNAATMSADGIFEYANALQDSTGYGADVITEGAAVLATFKNVRNEVGKGNEIFDRATKAGLDMAAKGLGEPKQNAILLGKALNNPAKGISALTRVGVDFTDAQKEQIKTMMESGDVMGAQKVILGELEGQVGGASEAYGETMAGQVERAKRSFEEIAKELASVMIPIFNVLAGIVQKVAGFFREHSTLAKVLVGVVAALAAAILAANVVLKVHGILTRLQAAYYVLFATNANVATGAAARQGVVFRVLNAIMRANPLVRIITLIIAVGAALVLAYKKSETFRNFVQALWGALKTVFSAIKDAAVAVYENGIKPLWDGAKTAFKAIGTIIKALYTAVIKPWWDQVKAIFDLVISLLKGDFKGAWDAAKRLVKNAVEGIKTFIFKIPSFLLEVVKKIPSAALSIGKAILKGIKDGLVGLANWIWEQIKAIPGRLKQKLKAAVSSFNPFGKTMPEGWKHPLAPGNTGRSLQPMGRSTVNVNVVSGGDQRILVSEEQVARAVYRVLARSDARNGLEFA